MSNKDLLNDIIEARQSWYAKRAGVIERNKERRAENDAKLSPKQVEDQHDNLDDMLSGIHNHLSDIVGHENIHSTVSKRAENYLKDLKKHIRKRK